MPPVHKCPPVSGVPVRSFPVMLAWTFAVVLSSGQLHVAAQQISPTRSFIAVTVADRRHRVVAGLDQESFVVLENGSARPITYFSNVDSPIAVAIVSEAPLPDDIRKPGDDVIQTSSLSVAVRQLDVLKNQRKAIIVTTAIDLRGIPSGVQVLHADPANILKAVAELRNQYIVGFRRSDPSARVEVTLNQPRNLPALEVVGKTPF